MKLTDTNITGVITYITYNLIALSERNSNGPTEYSLSCLDFSV